MVALRGWRAARAGVRAWTTRVAASAAATLARLSCPNCMHVHLPRVSELGCELTAPVVVWAKRICGGSCDAASLAAYIIVLLLEAGGSCDAASLAAYIEMSQHHAAILAY